MTYNLPEQPSTTDYTLEELLKLVDSPVIKALIDKVTRGTTKTGIMHGKYSAVRDEFEVMTNANIVTINLRRWKDSWIGARVSFVMSATVECYTLCPDNTWLHL